MMEACINQSAFEEKSGSLEKNCANFDTLDAEMEARLRTGSSHGRSREVLASRGGCS